MKLPRWGALLIALAVAIASAPLSQGASVPREPDPGVVAALKQIRAKQEIIKEVLIEDITTTYSIGGKAVSISKGRMLQQPPDKFYEEHKTVWGRDLGRVEGIACNGHVAYMLGIASPESLKAMERKMRDIGQGESSIQSSLKYNRIRYEKVDVDKLREAGVHDKHIATWFFHPETKFHLNTWKLAAETPTQWTFSATQFVGFRELPVVLVFSKENGLCVRREFEDTNRRARVAAAAGKVTINPATPIPESQFEFTPPKDADVLDVTDDVQEDRQTFDLHKE